MSAPESLPAIPEGAFLTLELGIGCANDVQADEDLLREGFPAIRVATLGDRALSVGAAVPMSAEYLDRARTEGCTIVRRASGGTAVLHAPGDLAWTLVIPRTDPRFGNDYVRRYDRFGGGVARYLRSEGISAHWVDPPGLPTDYCLLGSRGSVLEARGKILGGAAQHLTARALLHHGAIARTLDRRTLERLFGLPVRPGLDRLTSLEELGLREPSEVLAERLAQALVEEWNETGRS
ncbi:MAG TPA: hypothetical protein VEK13_04810 [Thermoplasmata archaeon]|nr:hypothetical protein [Thermoplasmata archaeon]